MSFLSLIGGQALCAIGRHKLSAYRRLTEHSAEWRCTREGCDVQFVNCHEPFVGWAFRGKHPYGGTDGLGQTLESKGRDEGADQSILLPFRDVTQAEAAIALLAHRFKGQDRVIRLPLLVYLVDWKRALMTGQTLTGLQWTARHAGPEWREVSDIAYQVQRLNISPDHHNLLPEDNAAIEHVIEKTASLSNSDLLLLVMSTRPLFQSRMGDKLDLAAEAAAQNAEAA